MSDLSLRLQQAASQLPVSSYFDQALFERELETIFKRGPRYVGHELAVPEIGDYYALPQEKEGRALVRNAKGEIELISNVCRHRQAVMLKGRGSLHQSAKGSAGGNIVCPIHRWTYSSSGELLGAPHFAEDPGLHLPSYGLREWNGLLFEDNGRDIAFDLAGMGVALAAHKRCFANALVALAQPDALFAGQTHQRHARLVQQPCIGGERDRFVLHRGLYVDHSQ